jgi:hypothetical protein
LDLDFGFGFGILDLNLDLTFALETVIFTQLELLYNISIYFYRPDR